jgi:putative endonuclease
MVERVRLRRINRPKPPNWHSEPGRFWAYVIRSEATGTLYVGHTNDLEGRLRQHESPETNRSLYTKRNRGPWSLVLAEQFTSRAEAMARERVLKSGQGRAWLKAVLEAQRPRE